MAACRKIIFGALALQLLAGPAAAQTAPGWTFKQVPTTEQWNAIFASKQDYLGAPPLLTTGGTMAGKLIAAASTTSNAGFGILPGVAPTSPINGDLWTTNAGLFVRISGTTVGPRAGAGGGSFAATAPIALSFPSGVVTYSVVSSPTFTGTIQGGTQASQFGLAGFSARGSSSAIEFGHSNTSGFGNTLSQDSSSGQGYLGFDVQPGTTANTYKTVGVLASIFKTDLVGGFLWGTTTLATGDNQAIINSATLSKTGILSPIGAYGNSLWMDARVYAVSPVLPSTLCAGFDDTASLQAAVAAFVVGSAGGQTLELPAKNGGCTISSPLTFLNTVNAKIAGQGAGIGLSGASVSGITYAGTTGSAINVHGVSGFDIGNVRITYNSASYTSKLVDLSQAGGASLSAFIRVHDAFIGGVGATAINSGALIYLNNTLNTHIDHVLMQNGVYAVLGTTNSNNVDISHGWFQQGFTGPHINVSGEGWLIRSNSFEPVNAGAVANSINASGVTYGLTIFSNIFNDSSSGRWADLSGGTVYGLSIIGNQFQGATDAINLGPAVGVFMGGNAFTTASGGCAVYASAATSVIAIGNTNTTGNPIFCTVPTLGNSLYDAGLGLGFVMTSGLQMGVPTGGYKGVGSLNAQSLFVNNVAVLTANQTITLTGAVTGSGATTIATTYGTQGANTILGNATSGTASPTALAVPSCSGVTQAIVWVLNTGWNCNGAITANAVPAANLTGATLASGVTASSLTSFGASPTLATPVINGLPTGTGVATGSTVSTLVARDGSGNFSAVTVTASLTGHASLDLALTGGTMSGAIAMGGSNITGAGAITATSVTAASDFGGAAAGSTKLINGTSNGSPSSAFANLQSNGQFVSIGNTSPKTYLDINENLSSSPALAVATSMLRLQASDTVTGGMEMVFYGGASPTAGQGNWISGLVSGGTSATPAAVGATSLSSFNLRAGGWNGSAWAYSTIIVMSTAGVWSGSANGGRIQFYTTPSGTTSLAVGMTLQDSGGLSVGTGTDPGIGSLQVNANIFAPNLPTTTAALAAAVCWTTTTGQFQRDTNAGGCLVSAARFKHGFDALSPVTSFATVMGAKPYSYLYNDNEALGRQVGFKADDFVDADRRLVGFDDSGDVHSFRYQQYTAVLTSAFQHRVGVEDDRYRELRADNENLRREVDALKQNRK